MTTDTLSRRERSVLRRAQRSAAWPRGWTLAWYGLMAGIAGWFASGAVSLWNVDRDAAWADVSHTLWFAALVFVALELDVAFRLLARFAPTEGAGSPQSPPEAAPAATTSVPGRGLAGHEVRRLIRAPGYAEHLERLRWLHPILAAGAVVSAVGALAWVDIPRPLDLVVAGMAGVSIAATVSVARLRGWVQLAAKLADRRAEAR